VVDAISPSWLDSLLCLAEYNTGIYIYIFEATQIFSLQQNEYKSRQKKQYKVFHVRGDRERGHLESS
jgi:hypothetical protein